MIESVQELPLMLTNNASSITFSADDIKTRSANCCNGWLSHTQGSPLYQLLDGGYYEISFNTNVSSATAGIVAFGLYQDSVLVPGSTVASTISTPGDVENLKFKKVIKVCCRANTTLTISSVPSFPNLVDLTATGIDTQTPIIVNANMIIKKIP